MCSCSLMLIQRHNEFSKCLVPEFYGRDAWIQLVFFWFLSIMKKKQKKNPDLLLIIWTVFYTAVRSAVKVTRKLDSTYTPWQCIQCSVSQDLNANNSLHVYNYARKTNCHISQQCYESFEVRKFIQRSWFSTSKLTKWRNLPVLQNPEVGRQTEGKYLTSFLLESFCTKWSEVRKGIETVVQK